jgi:hypothetical protein
MIRVCAAEVSRSTADWASSGSLITGSTTSPSSSADVGPEITWLIDLQPVKENSKGWTTKPVHIRGTTYTKALAVRTVWCDSIQLDYVLEGQYARFKALVGMANGSPETTPLNFYVLADAWRGEGRGMD